MAENAKHVLVVDDDESIRVSLSEILKRAGYRVDAAKDAVEALKKVCDSFFDVILIDINLPGMDGIELLKKLSKNKETVKIIITGYPTTEHGNEAADYGADDFLVKPVQPQELLMAIEERLAKV